MRIVLDLQACQASSRHRGIGRYSMSLALAMARQAGDHELRIVLNRHFPDAFDAIRTAFDGLIPASHISSYDIPVPAAELAPQNAWRVRAAEQVREAFLLLQAPDIVHVASLFEGLVEDAPVAIGQGAGLGHGRFATAVTLYDLIPLLRKETYLTGAPVKAWYYRKLQSLKNSALLLAISAHSRQEAISALQLAPQQIVNISSAVDGAFHPRQLGTDALATLRARYGLTRPFVMYTGGIDFRKNIEGLIEAFSRMPIALRKAHQLAIVCMIEPAERLRLGLLARSFGLAPDELILTGFVSDADLVALYNSTEVFVFPSLQEGFGLPALEAMSCGTATIGSNTSSIPEVIGRADALFDPTDINAIAGKIVAVLTDDGFRHSLQAHGLQQAKLFSWDASAKTTLDAFEALHARRHHVTTVAVAATPVRRPRLAFVSPLPPAQSGIADYSAQLLPELARHYDIEVVIDQSVLTEDWVTSNFPVRSASWFERHGGQFDRILYHFGNSDFHTHMFENLIRHPGVVVLHDFYLSGIVNHVERAATWPNAFCRSLYESHGYPALLDELQNGREAAIYAYPCNKPVLDNAAGVIVHSGYSMQLARQWYGPHAADNWRYIPLLKAAPAPTDRLTARALAGIVEGDFVVASFGHLGATKLNRQLLDAWLNSPLARDNRCHLVFVGASSESGYCKALEEAIAQSPASARIRITGFASPERYRAYLSCTDIAVQLRGLSRGETSAAVLDCLAYGVATIVNANGSAAELRDDVLIKLPDVFQQAALTDALIALWSDAAQRQSLSQAAMQFMQVTHEPARIGDAYHDVIEQYAQDSLAATQRVLTQSLATIDTLILPSANDLELLAASMVSNRTATAPHQLLIDITAFLESDLTPCDSNAAINALRELIMTPPAGYRVEPFYQTAACRRYARQFTLQLLGRPELVLEDDPIDVRRNDRIVSFLRDADTASTTVDVSDAGAIAASLPLWLPTDALTESNLQVLQAHLHETHADRDVRNEFMPVGIPIDPVMVPAVTDDTSAGMDPDATIATMLAQLEKDAHEDMRESVPAPALETLDTILVQASDDARPFDPSAAQLLVDITMLVRTDDKSGIQRVVRSILKALLAAPPAGMWLKDGGLKTVAVRPVYDAGGYYAYARHCLTSETNETSAAIGGVAQDDDIPIHLNAGDIFLGLDLAPDSVAANQALYADMRRHDVRVYFVVYDLLPVLQPDVFAPGAAPWFANWLHAVSTSADGLVCISQAVADDLRAWQQQERPDAANVPDIGYFHLGADIVASLPSRGIRTTDRHVLEQVASRPSFLMVGTLEPRKSHTQVLHAFELLWTANTNINLVIVGKQGWMVEALVEKLRAHPEKGKRLFWMERVSDEMLLELYDASAALIAASVGEGFGLPLIEAAIQSLPIIARDMPVFREVCGEHAFYFSGITALSLADVVAEWLALDRAGTAPQSASIPRLTWAQSARQLTNVIYKNH